MQPLRIGVMGCASIAWRTMIPALASVPGLRLVAVASRSPEKAQRFAQRFGCLAVAGYDELLARPDVDAVYLPLPTGLHREWVTRALESGRHVLAEKALAASPDDARAMIDAARRSGRLLLESYAFVHHVQHARARDTLGQGALGALRLLRATFPIPSPPAGDFRYRAELGGGALLDLAGYVVRAAMLFLGPDLELLSASLDEDPRAGVDVRGSPMFRAPDGRVAQLSWGFGLHYQCRYELLGSAGKLVAERAFTPPPSLRPVVRVETDGVEQVVSMPAADQYAALFADFAETAAAGPAHPGFERHAADALGVALLTDAIRRAGAPSSLRSM